MTRYESIGRGYVLPRLEADRRSGEWHRRHGHLHLLDLDLDVGLRIVVGDSGAGT